MELEAGPVDLAGAAAAVDLHRRLREIPPGARVRGVWFGMIPRSMRRLGAGAEMSWRRLVCVRPRSVFRMYDVREYVQELFAAAAILAPRDPAEGMRAIWRDACSVYVDSPLGATCRRLLRLDPMVGLRFIERHRDHFADYGRWRVEACGEGHAVMHMYDEYIWIDSAHRGGCEGLLATLGVEATVVPELSSPFDGRLHIRWRRPENGRDGRQHAT